MPKPAPASDPVDLHVGRAIRARRQLTGVSQSHLAEEIGVSFQQIQKYERGANRVSASMLAKIAQVLQASPAAFFPDAANAEADPFGLLYRFGAERGALALADYYLAFGAAEREALVTLCAAMLGARSRGRHVA